MNKLFGVIIPWFKGVIYPSLKGIIVSGSDFLFGTIGTGSDFFGIIYSGSGCRGIVHPGVMMPG